MGDVYIYLFATSNSQDGSTVLSTRPATLETIKHRQGAPVMESQMVIDHTELDPDGFLVEALVGGSHATNDIAAQISSLEVRAASRDAEVIASSDEQEKYMLRLESRELRKQARVLQSRLTVERELCFKTDARDFIHFGVGVLT